MAFLTQNIASLFEKCIITLVFEKDSNIFEEKLAKITENKHHKHRPQVGVSKSKFFINRKIRCVRQAKITPSRFYQGQWIQLCTQSQV
jgi:hypothetical protein